jgi:DNA topoisomerase-2
MPSKYTHLSQRNQTLKRPAQHIGSAKTSTQKMWLAQTEYIDSDEKERIVEQIIDYNPGLIHIFYEVLSNAQDNYFQSKDSEFPLRKIEVSVDQDTGRITVWNDGLWIPTKIHEWSADEEVIDKNDHYEAEIIFGHLNSSSNYNDEEKARIGGGLHGLGVKLTNIFSTEFTVECFDPETGLRFKQTFTNNMSDAGKPKISKLKQKKGYTKVSFIADFKRFGVDGYTDEHLAVIKKICIDCAMITGQRVIFNGSKIPVKNLLGYTRFYTDTKYAEFKSVDSTVILCEKPAYEAGIIQISFVNGICTHRGGIHVDEWTKAIFRPLLEKIKMKFSPKGKKSTPIKLTMKNLESYFMFFINCNLNNPEFDSNTKTILTTPRPHVDVPDSKINSLMRWGFIQDIKTTIDIQGMKELQKTDGKKSASVSIPKLDDANKAGTVKSQECTLFIVEGDSAKTFATAGISAIEHGTDWYGVLPVRGKLLNVRACTKEQLQKNVEISQIKKTLGLRHGADYSDPKERKSLRYGRVGILTDADYDGDHIKGLIINFFQYFFPDLLSNNFITSIRTPIIKAKIGQKSIAFYYKKDFKDWAMKQNRAFTAKYYKGLGTWIDEEIRKLFEEPRNVLYVDDKSATDSVDKLFSKSRANDRKEWLENYQEKEFVYDTNNNGEEIVPISDFFNNEMIGFSIYDCQRSVPSVIDGLKPSQRKAIWVGLRVLKEDLKVAQFAAEVAKQSEYHHGEVSMENAIIGMAQTFVGANNIALFYESGQFGSRLQGGRDSASPRYIYTRLASVARSILRKEDDPILEYIEEDGKMIEPKYFVPIIPLLLVNGCRGIGTGYSSTIPAFNPLDLVKWIKVWLNEGMEYPELSPWYWGFKGRTERDENDENKFYHYGEFQKIQDNLYEITELPVGVWTDDYKELLNSLKSATKENIKGYESMTIAQLKEELGNRELMVSGIKKVLVDRLKAYDKENGTSPKKSCNSGQLLSKWEWYGDNYNVKFKVWTKPNVELSFDDPKFKLTSTERLSNMTAFMPSGGIKKYANLNDILHTFCQVRLEYYQKRKKHLITVLKEKLLELENKARFIKEILSNFNILKQTKAQLFDYLEKNDYWKKDGSYKYLTNIPVGACTKDKYNKLLAEIEEIKEEITYIKTTSPKQMWLRELDEFVDAYGKWKLEIEAGHANITKGKLRRRVRKK